MFLLYLEVIYLKKNTVKQYRLGDLVSFEQGVNSARAEKQYGLVNVIYYDQASFEKDYNHEDGFVEGIENLSFNDYSLNEGDVIISNALQQATMVGTENAGKVPSINFTKVNFRDDIIDKKYFLYLFNNHSSLKRQKEREVQGNIIPKIPIKALNGLIVPIVSKDEQIKIGQIYTDTLKLKAKLIRYSELIEQFTNSVLEKTLKEDKNRE